MRIFFIFENYSKNWKNWSFRPPQNWGTFLAQFTHVPIFHPNEWICKFQLSWSENMKIFFIFENFSKNRKNWSFRPPQNWGTFLAQFTHVPIFHPNEWICIFQLSWSENMRIFFIFENFSKNWKNWSFCPPWTLGTFLAQFTHVPIIHPNEWICIFQLSWSENMRIFSFFELFTKSEKLKFSPTVDLGNFFGSIHSCAHFPSKWVNIYILVVLEWEHEDFLHFWSIHPTRTAGSFLAQFIHVPIFHRNEWICIF